MVGTWLCWGGEELAAAFVDAFLGHGGSSSVGGWRMAACFGSVFTSKAPRIEYSRAGSRLSLGALVRVCKQQNMQSLR